MRGATARHWSEIVVAFVHGSVLALHVMSNVAEWTCLVHECDTQGFVFICFVVFCRCFSSWFCCQLRKSMNANMASIN